MKRDRIHNPINIALELFQAYCDPNALSFEDVTRKAEIRDYPQLSRIEIESLIHGTIAFETRGWIVNRHDHQFVLLVERGGGVTQANLLDYRTGAVVYGPPVGEGFLNPFEPNQIGGFSCKMLGRAEITAQETRIVQNFSKSLRTPAPKIWRGEANPVGRATGERWPSLTFFVEHDPKTAADDDNLFSFSYSVRSPDETILPNFRFSRGAGIIKQEENDEEERADE
ncbi:MAG: hypothetical protein AAFZ74_08975 [Pseudomonadota bacterium]